MKFKFTTVAEEGDGNRASVTMEMHEDSTTFEMMENFQGFLQALGYILPEGAEIGYVYEDDDCCCCDDCADCDDCDCDDDPVDAWAEFRNSCYPGKASCCSNKSDAKA